MSILVIVLRTCKKFTSTLDMMKTTAIKVIEKNYETEISYENIVNGPLLYDNNAKKACLFYVQNKGRALFMLFSYTVFMEIFCSRRDGNTDYQE